MSHTTVQPIEVHQRSIPNASYIPDELGLGWRQTPADLLASLAMPTKGEVFDLDAGRWVGMPVLPVHPSFTITTYRTPRGSKVDGDMPVQASVDGAVTGVMTELTIGSTHTGTHIDALCHVTSGSEWFGHGNESEHLGDYGPIRAEASSIPPFVCRGVLLDIAALHDVSALPAGTAIGAEDIKAALTRQEVTLRPGDAVLLRTGYMSVWTDSEERRAAHYGAGLDVGGAVFLAGAGAVLMGSDTEDFECVPSTIEGSFLPVHVELLTRRGVHIVELLHLEDLATAGVDEFLFLGLSLRLRGATGSMLRPIAVV